MVMHVWPRRSAYDPNGSKRTHDREICSRGPVRARGGEHLGRKHRRCRTWPSIQPHALGYHGDPLRRGRPGPAALPDAAGLALDRLGWLGVAALVLGGAPTVMLANAGLLFAPASHAGALFPGVMPLTVAVLAAVILKEPFTPQKKAGFVLIATGVVGIVWGSGGTIGTTQNIGHLFFLGAAMAFACYTVAMRRARLDGLHAAAISAVGSMLIYM